MKKTLTLTGIIVLAAASVFAAPKFKVTKANGVVGYFSFDEEVKNKIVKDESDFGSQIKTNAENTVLVDGKFGKALSFDGSEEYVSFNEDLLQNDSFSICVWVKADEWRNWCRVWDIGNRRPDVYCAVDGRTPGILGLHEEKTGYQVYSFLPKAKEWIHIAAVYGNGTMAMYQNGVLMDEVKAPVTVEEFRNAEGKGLYFGHSNWNDPYFKGAMDEILLVNRKLSAKEVKAVMKGLK